MLAAVIHGKQDLRIQEMADQPLRPDDVRVKIAFGGICGSDLHYFHRGAVGDFMLREPMILGHEISGSVIEFGSDVHGLTVGSKVALNPSRPCRTCQYCIDGRSNLCERMRFLGSASIFPHVAGGFAQNVVLRADQVLPVPPETDLLRLSCAEPLSVGLHALHRASGVFGKRVIISGCGPIGLLTAAAATRLGAREVVITDIEDAPLLIATTCLKVASAINVASNPDALGAFASNGGHFDVAIEASGSVPALQSLFQVVKRGARIVQTGMMPPGPVALPVNLLQSREIELVGAFRAHDEFQLAVDYIVDGMIDVSPILSGVFALQDAEQAFLQAGDRKKAIKLHLALA